MRKIIPLLLLIFASLSTGNRVLSHSDRGFSESGNTLWYRQPAAKWAEALPIGNGRLGAMIFGGLPNEKIQINEDTIWAGEKRDRNNPQGARNLAEVRKLLVDAKPVEAEQLAEKTIISIPKRLPPYQPLGDLAIRFNGIDQTSDYRRSLDLDTGIVSASFKSGDAQFRREIFSSAVDQVIVIRLTSDKPSRLGFAVTLDRAQDSKTGAIAPDRVIIEGEAIARGDRHQAERKVGVKFRGVLKVIPEGDRKSVV